MLLMILMIGGAVVAFRQQELKITRNRVVRGSDCKTVGAILLIGAIGGFLIWGWLQIIGLVVAIVYGLMKAEKI
jgi:hypothetical protein